MSLKKAFNEFFKTEKKTEKVSNNNAVVDPGGPQFEDSVIKSVIPSFLYKPPYGHPRTQDVVQLRRLEKNAYIHSIIQTIQHEVSSAKRKIVVNEKKKENYELKNKIMSWFMNPNGNAESFDELLRALVRDILVLDSGIWVKVFNTKGEFTQIFCRDGATFLKNPDPHGYLGDKDDYIPFWTWKWDDESNNYRLIKAYDENNDEEFRVISEKAAYFQYGWTRGGTPIPFGKREIMWFSNNPLSDSVYGRSPVEVLGNVLLTLIYGAAYNMDFYLNNNMPDGILSLIGVSASDLNAFRARFTQKFYEKDSLEYNRRIGHQFPIVNVEPKFIPFNLSSRDMEIINQQEWFWKLTLACFGVTPSEMGFTSDSNRATEAVQSSIFKRKAIAPILRMIEYRINLQLMPELDPSGTYKFKFDDYDLQEDLAKHQLYQIQAQLGIKTAEMIAEEEGIDVHELKRQKEEARSLRIEEQQYTFGNYYSQFPNGSSQQASDEARNDEKETKNQEEPVDEDVGIDEYMRTINRQTMELVRELSFSDDSSLRKPR